MEQHFTASIRLTLTVAAAVFAVLVYQAASRPIGSTEAYKYDRFVRPHVRQMLAQEFPNRDVLYTLLEKRSVGLFHVSPFSVRVPGLLFGMLFLWSAWRLGGLPAMAIAGLGAVLWGGFTVADGNGAAVALELCAIQAAVRYLIYVEQDGLRNFNLNISGACLGLSVVARQEFVLPGATIAMLLGILTMRRGWSVWMDRVLIPAVVVGFVFLVLPLSHAHAAAEITPDLTLREAVDLQSALSTLRASIGTTGAAVGASGAAEPIVNFYRDQHRATNWKRAERNLAAGRFDYYVLSRSDFELVRQRHLEVLFQNPNFLVARPAIASM